MANCCMSVYVFYGKKESVERFYTFLSELNKKCSKDGITANIRGTESTFHLLNYYLIQDALNIPEKDMTPGRGNLIEIWDLENDWGDEAHFEVAMDEAWNPYPEVWENIFKRYFSSNIKIAYKAEEPGCDLFYICDPDGRFFSEEYLVDMFLGRDSEWKYFETEDACFDYCRKMISAYCKDKDIAFNEELYPDLETLGGFIDKQVNDNGTEDDFFYIHKFQYAS